MTVTDQDLADLAADVVESAVEEIVHERMAQAEQLEDHLEGLGEEEQEVLLDRFEAALKRYLPTPVFDVENGEFLARAEDDDS